MANIFDYLKWRGGLSLDQADFNNVDALILSRLVYIPFEGIVLGGLLDKITISNAADIFFTLKEPLYEANMPEDVELLGMLAKCERFKNMRLSGYVNEVEPESQKQFAAIIIDTCDNSYFISYRGTDSTLVGWKEDFNMSFTTPVPAQEDAVCYLEKAVSAILGNIRVGGHSKGGNLAVYAASFCSQPVQKRIVEVYNNDGPGFDISVISKEGYTAMCDRVQTFVPQSSVVGMLLEHEEKYRIVHSKQIGLFQHDLYSWEIMNGDFVYLETVSNSSRFIDGTLKNWLLEIESEQREQVVDAIFEIFQATGAQTLKELTVNWYKNAQHVLKSMNNMDESLKKIISQTLLALFRSAKQNLPMLRKP